MDTNPSGSRVRSAINVTPLVDIVLVLLIIFIVIAPAVNDAVHLPVAKHARRVEGQKPLTLQLSGQVHEGKTLSICEPGEKAAEFQMGRDGEPQRVQALIRRRLAGQEDRPVLIKADGSMPFKELNALFQFCRECGASEVSLVTGEETTESIKGGQS